MRPVFKKTLLLFCCIAKSGGNLLYKKRNFLICIFITAATVLSACSKTAPDRINTPNTKSAREAIEESEYTAEPISVPRQSPESGTELFTGTGETDHASVFAETRNPDGVESSAETGRSVSGETDRTDTAANETFIIPEGNTPGTRIRTPQGYTRVPAEQGSLAEFIRNYPLKEDKSPVLLYDGTKKRNQTAHAAVFSLPIEAEDLQQCADSVIRLYAEYFRETGQDEKIAFHFVNGFLAEYVKWREGYRIKVNGNDVVWEKTASYDDSYESFAAYLRMVFAYAGTLSMEGEAEETTLGELEAGDVFLQGGSPGHVVLVLDVCENADGRKAFLLGQGYMPAQEFHVLKNPKREEDPWYYEEEVTYPFQTPEYTFIQGSLKRLVL